MATGKSLSDISQQLEEMQYKLDVGCECPSGETLEEMIKGILIRAPPSVPVMFSAPDNENWISPPFYTHPRGYQMRLEITVDKSLSYSGYCRGASSSYHYTKSACYANFFLQTGEFDDYLRFPIQMSLDLHVIKKNTAESHSITYKFDKDTPIECTRRRRDRYPYSAASYNSTYYNVDCEYLRGILLLKADEVESYSIDDTLTFKVTNVVTNNLD